jgi:NAD(P)H-hydrate epimerase
MTVKRCKEIDKYAIENLHIPSLILMENAATAVYEKIKDTGNKFLVICGTGNNGGDGLVIGRKLLLQGKDVCFVIVNPKDKFSEDFKTNFEIVKSITANIIIIKSLSDMDNFRGLLNDCDVIVDSLFGVGINRELDAFYCKLIECINESNKYVVAIDIPSGLDGDTGLPLGNAVIANVTYSFEVIKRGFINYSAFKYIGNIEIVKFGIPESVKELNDEGIRLLDRSYYQSIIKKRSLYGYKGDYGKVTIFAGSLGFAGAAYITTEACVKSGAGLTTLVTPMECQRILSGSLIEAMTANYSEKTRIKNLVESSDVIAFGPGIKSEKEFEEILLWIADNSTSNIVIDAEGINILSRREDILEKLRGRMVLTPHLGEMSRLLNIPINEIEDNRVEIAKEYAKKQECILLLKGYYTVITDGNNVFVNSTGDSKMASGGMGDCLTGIIASLIGQGNTPLEGALLGAYVHGLSGQRCKEKYSVTARDVIENIPFIMNELIIK